MSFFFLQFIQVFKAVVQMFRFAKLRTLLTILGIVIGIAAVMIVMSVGASVQYLVLSQVRGIGTNLIGILPGASSEDGPPASAFGIVTTSLTNDDLEAIQDLNNVPDLVSATGYVSGSIRLQYRDTAYMSTYQGVSASFANVEDVSFQSGHFFTSNDEERLSRVVVLGSTRAKDLFGTDDPLGKTISLGRERFRVIGVLKERGAVAFSNPDLLVYIPLTTAQKILLGIDYVNFIRAKVVGEEFIDRARADIRLLLRARHDINSNEEDDFSVRSLSSAISVLTNITNIMTYFLSGVAAISLIIGGIGVMNIMLIAAHQRITEIGLRKALGARDRDILLQFLSESVVISLLGGIIGILFGIFVTYMISLIIPQLGYEWTFFLRFDAVMIAFILSLCIGIVFGLYPARKASKISPIEALRYE